MQQEVFVQSRGHIEVAALGPKAKTLLAKKLEAAILPPQTRKKTPGCREGRAIRYPKRQISNECEEQGKYASSAFRIEAKKAEKRCEAMSLGEGCLPIKISGNHKKKDINRRAKSTRVSTFRGMSDLFKKPTKTARGAQALNVVFATR